jgi:hypothetical protein
MIGYVKLWPLLEIEVLSDYRMFERVTEQSKPNNQHDNRMFDGRP